MMTTRIYLLIGLGMAGFIFLVATLFGTDIAAWAVTQKGEAAARGQNVFELMVFEPIRFVFDEDTRIVGSVILIFFWPLIILMFFLVLLALVIMSGIDTNDRLGLIESYILPLWWR
jgi:hypothetical protein